MSKITDKDFKDYKDLIQKGYSQRQACTVLGIARGTMQYHIKRLLDTTGVEDISEVKPKTNLAPVVGAKILSFDLETSIPIVATFGRIKVFLNHENIIQEGGKIICASYQWIYPNGVSQVQLIHMTHDEIRADDDSRMCAELWELFNEADAVVCHNASTFDFPVVKTRCMVHNLPPLPTVKVIDTLIMARKNFRFPSNRLADLAAYLGLEAKKDAGGVQTWIRYRACDQEAIDHMHYYCKHDTVLLTQMYLKLRNYGHTGSDFNAGLYAPVDEDTGILCTVCASPVENTGRYVYTSVSQFDELRCTSCGHVTRSRKNLVANRDHLASAVKLKG